MRLVLGLLLAVVAVAALPVLTGLLAYALDKYLLGGCRAAYRLGRAWLGGWLREWRRG
ncbi:hypothetical protein [Bordetella petrii]|uniref:hypothetical protein n=1 Tax=Bordetella petrii TaxID=94624 RepID=UPI001A95F646|nr:hypothetical protein [Bordetella petrii]MBO1112568.1 hypothetical protein [Bordetella petrii]